jgi:WD40 repeat protein
LLFTGYDDTYIHGWDVVSPEHSPHGRVHVTLANHEARITEVGVAPSGQALASCSWDTQVKVYI